MTLRHSTNVVVADDGISPVGTDEWNADHVVATDFSPPSDGGATLGTTIKQWDDVHIAASGTLNWAAGTYSFAYSTTSFTDGLVSINKDFIVQRKGGFGSFAKIGRLSTCPGGQEEEENDSRHVFTVNEHMHGTSPIAGTGAAAFFGLTAEDAGNNGFTGHNVSVCTNVENIGDFPNGLYFQSLFGINFSNTISSTNWYYNAQYVGLYDYGNLALPCRSSYDMFLAQDVEAVHHGTGTATDVIAARFLAYNGQFSGAAGACTNMTSVQIRTGFAGAYQNITNARGLHIKDHSAIGASAMNANIHSEGAASVNLFDGIVRLGTATNSSPSNGDLWFDGTDLKFRTGGVTKTVTLT